MSVILDALRRGRRGREVPASRPAPRSARGPVHVPTGLGLGSSPALTTRPTRGRLFALAALLVIVLGAWAAIQVTRGGAPSGASVAPAAGGASVTPGAGRASVAPGAGGASVAAGAGGAGLRPEGPLRGGASEARPTPDSRTANPESRIPNPGGSHFDQAVQHQMAGNLDEAATQYLAAIAQNDRGRNARNHLGLLYRSRGLLSEAIDQFKRALAIDPRYVNARNHLAVALMEAGRLTEAREELESALALDPRNVDLLVNQALVEKSERHPERAMELLLRAIGDRPMHAAAHYNLALLYDERNALSLAYGHYTDFLAYAGPEYRGAIADVRQRLQAIAPAAGAAAK